jgi:hypothetical protein
MKTPKFAHKVIIVGRKINLDAETDVAATFRRVRAEQAKDQQERDQKVSPIIKQKKSA